MMLNKTDGGKMRGTSSVVGAYVNEKGKKSLTFSEPLNMGVRKGGQEGALASPPPPPWPGKILCFLTLIEKNSIFLGFLRQIVYFCPPLEKSLRTPMPLNQLLS